MLDKILKFLPIYSALYALKYFIVLLQLPYSLLKVIFVKPEIKKINEYSKQNKFIFIYASIEPKISESSLNILNVVKELGGYIILVTNLSNYDFNEQSKPMCDVFINNKDRGWDFSQYKLASNYIYNNLAEENFSKVIYSNDSVFFIASKLKDQFYKLLNNEYEVSSFFDGSGRHNYHFGSWFISVGKNIFLDLKVRKFWTKFFEVKNKFYAITQGEFSFSKVLLSLNPKTFVVYNNHYLNSLKELNFSNMRYISARLLKDFFDTRNFIYGSNDKNDDPLKDYISHNLIEYPAPQTLCLILLKFHDMPFIKKDLFWHEHQSMSSLYFLCSILDDKINKDYANTIKAYFLKRDHITAARFYIKLITLLGIR
jgi:hypothetical protein